MIEHNGIFINESDNKDFIDFCLRARKNDRYITVTYNKGYADYSGIFKELKSGLFQRTFKIGKSTGVKPILLEINSDYSSGGSGLFANIEAIKSWKYSQGEEENINEALGTSLYDLIESSYEESEEGIYELNYKALMNKVEVAIQAVA